MEDEFDFWVLSFDGTLATRDLNGLRIAAPADTDINDALEAEGAITLALATSEIYAALQTGVIDAAALATSDPFADLVAADDGLSLYKFAATEAGVLARALVPAIGAGPTQGDDVLVGTSGDDDFALFGGDDSFASLGGADTVEGGAGTDTVIFPGASQNVTVTLREGLVLVDDRSTTDGASRLTEVERLAFDGSDFDLNTFGGLGGLTGPQLAQFIELYIAYFNRAPDAIGLGFWGTAFANGTTLEQTAALFIDQDETRATYPDTLSNAEFATAVYNNVLGRVADAAGFDFWVGVLNDGSVGRDQFIREILRGAKADPPAGSDQAFVDQQLADQKYLSDKTDIGTYFAVTLGMSDVAEARAAMALFDGSEASVLAAVAQIETYHAAASDASGGAFLLPLAGVLENPFATLSFTDLPNSAETPMEVDLSGDGLWSSTDSRLAELARIEVPGDVDWISFFAEPGQNYRIQLQSTQPDTDLDFDVQIRDSSGSSVGQGVQTGDEDFNFRASSASPPEHYFEVTAFADRAVVVGSYILTVTEIE